MDKEIINIIGFTCLKHHDSGLASVTKEARLIIEALRKAGYEIKHINNSLLSPEDNGNSQT